MEPRLPTAATLSDWLRRSGTLPNGAVAHVHIDLTHKTAISRLVFLTATYTPDAPPDLPRRLVVKSPLVQPSVYSESEFYREVAPRFASPPLPTCHAVVDDGSGILVLEDLRATHDHPPWPIPPSREQSEAAVDVLARVHAACWESSTLGNTIGQPHTVQSLTSMVQGIVKNLSPFMDEFGDALTAEARQVYERVFSSSLKPWLRLTDSRALTIIHGDAHTWNFLFPRSGSGAAYLIDWQLWHIDVGARDLAYFMALHWYPGRRRELELPLLRRYHEALQADGIANYTFDDLLLDYRRCVVRNLTIPIILWSRGLNPEAWWHRLECALSAYRDLECDELL
jgi:aminoglycoside phosphotransferase (APT) family kinase protein